MTLYRPAKEGETKTTMLFSQRQKLARAVERRTRKDERALNPDPTNHIRTCIIRDAANTIRCLSAMGWLRDKPQRKSPKQKRP